ncbi:hypothetical protein LS3_15 [Escherichia virus LS3]|uniref:Uncharacterized protein n=1 Tax=Escherichia virus LS3 TaxID=2743777 RepID=A0ACD4R0Q3_9CAUD
MFKNLMFNRFITRFHLSHNPFGLHQAQRRLGYFGKAVKLSPTVSSLITHEPKLKARQKGQLYVPVVYTKWPRVRLFVEVVKEMF